MNVLDETTIVIEEDTETWPTQTFVNYKLEFIELSSADATKIC